VLQAESAAVTAASELLERPPTVSRERLWMGAVGVVLVGGLLLAGAIAFPLVKDVYMVQSIFLAICGGLGIQ